MCLNDECSVFLTGLVFDAIRQGNFDQDMLLDSIEQFAQQTGESFCGVLTVTETDSYGSDAVSVQVGRAVLDLQKSVSRATMILPSGIRYELCIEAYPEESAREIIDDFVDNRGKFRRNVWFGNWNFDRITGVSSEAVLYCTCSPLLAQDVELIFDNGEIFVRSSDEMDDERRIRSRDDLLRFIESKKN